MTLLLFWVRLIDLRLFINQARDTSQETISLGQAQVVILIVV